MSEPLRAKLAEFYSDEFHKDLGRPVASGLRNARDMRIAPIPDRYAGSPLGNYLAAHSADPNGIFIHQAMVGDESDEGHNLFIGTGTDSGKSRAFRAESFHQIAENPDARVLVLYTLRNLSKDQHRDWRDMAHDLGHKKSVVGKIDGSVDREDRMAILDRSRILLATPDIVHWWMMTHLNDFSVVNFLKNRRMTIMDEMDTYNGAFGTNMLFLLRRLQVHQTALGTQFPKHRYIGASATLPDPEGFFRELTGQGCTVIGEDQNGAPIKERMVVHHAVPKGNQFAAAKEMIMNKIRSNPNDLGIVFCDSRKLVEELSASINQEFGDEVAIPKKAGQSKEEEARLDKLISSGKARVIIATPAMEAGIDLPFSWGMNLGLPSSKRNLMQRIGRVGRREAGLFIILTPEDTFTKNSTYESFEKYLNVLPVEQPKLYPTNKTLQIANGFCYLDERKRLRASGQNLDPMATKTLKWPKGFASAVKLLGNPRENLTGEDRLLIPPEKTPPQHFHTLRNISGETFILSEKDRGGFNQIGSCSLQQALYEYPPGAIVWHQGQRYRVYGWDSTDGVHRIVMGTYTGDNTTIHHRSTEASISLNPSSVVGNEFFRRPRKSSQGKKAFFALARGRITQSVNSFVELTPSDKAYPYVFYDNHEIPDNIDKVRKQKNDYGPKRRSKMSTTGLVMYLPDFRISADKNVGDGSKRELFDMVLDEYCKGMGINRDDVGFSYKKAGVWISRKERLTDDVIYFHDTTPGSLGLSHGLLDDPKHSIFEVLKRVALKIDQDKQKGLARACRLMYKSIQGMKPVEAEKVLDSALPNLKPPDGCILVMPPGSHALMEESNGSSKRVKIIKPAVEYGTYGYEIEAVDREKAYTSAGAKRSSGRLKKDSVLTDKDRTGAPPISRHFVAANKIVRDVSTPWIAMNKESGELFQPANDSSSGWGAYEMVG